jgi:hypothetical protein
VNKPTDRTAVPLRAVTPGYFSLMRLPTTQGRDFRSSDARNAPNVAIVNQGLVDRYFGATDPIGKKIWSGGRDRPATEIVGVVANGRTGDLTRAPEPEIYLSLWQASAFRTWSFEPPAIRGRSSRRSGANCTMSIRPWPWSTSGRSRTCAPNRWHHGSSHANC